MMFYHTILYLDQALSQAVAVNSSKTRGSGCFKCSFVLASSKFVYIAQINAKQNKNIITDL